MPAVIKLATFAWLVSGLIRRSKYWRIAAGIFAAEILILVIGSLVYFTLVEYPRNYLKDPVPESGSLTKIASEIKFYIVTAVYVADNPAYRKLVSSEFSSIPPENYTMWHQLLVNDEFGNYAFSKADDPPRST